MCILYKDYKILKKWNIEEPWDLAIENDYASTEYFKSQTNENNEEEKQKSNFLSIMKTLKVSWNYKLGK